MKGKRTKKRRGSRARKSPWLMVLAFGLLAPVAGFYILDSLFPPPVPQGETRKFALTVLGQDGTPLRAFADKEGIWRYPASFDRLSPLYLDALIHYEDRYFYQHPGVNPLALGRAFFQYLKTGRVVSGGSTLTMQVARILCPHKRNVWGKVRQMFVALQLERRLTKEQILTLYANHAPFGGTIEGVYAASLTYLGKLPENLSHAEAALLAVLPQAPTRLRPDRDAARAEKARNKVLDRMADFGVWERALVEDAKKEQVLPEIHGRPMLAALAARRVKDTGRGKELVRTFIDPWLQESVEELVKGYVSGLAERTSAAVLVVDNRTLGISAYVGSADFYDAKRFGHVDMARATRSPGSTLKPFLYAFAMEEGLIHSQSLLVDAPLPINGYRPGNFSGGYSGPISAAEALVRSINICAVDLLDRVGPDFFDARLRQGGLNLCYPGARDPNLSMILGGVGTCLEDLVGAYSSLGREGLSGKPRLSPDEPVCERRMMSPGAAFIIREILSGNKSPNPRSGREVAWKTGTSYGHRDAWAIGLTRSHTIGVWVGRPDGTPSPGQHGRATAGPLLFMVEERLPRDFTPSPGIPDSVSREDICWPLGTCLKDRDERFCQVRKSAWILKGLVPPTLPDRGDRSWLPNPLTVWVNPETGLRVETECLKENAQPISVARWPSAAGPWLSPREREASCLPDMDPACEKPGSAMARSLRIKGIEPGTIFRPPGEGKGFPRVLLEAEGGEGILYWMVNGQLVGRINPDETRKHRFSRAGPHTITVMDLGGNHDTVSVVVLGKAG